MNETALSREQLGLAIAQVEGTIKRISELKYILNNKMERMNGEVRDREKVMRGLKRKGTTVLTGYQLYNNYFRPHEVLDGKTPAEKCGIIIEAENKWKTVIVNAARK